MFLKKWFNLGVQSEVAPFWKAYLALDFKTPPKKQQLDSTDFVVIDTETTGFHKTKDKILSIGAITIHQGEIQVSNAFECYIAQDVEATDSIMIHGIMPHNHHTKITEQEALIQLLNYIENKIIVGHHIGFDMMMLNQALSKYNNNDKLKNITIDTAHLYHRLKYPLEEKLQQQEDYTLDVLTRAYNISESDRHTAAGDAFITGILFLKLLNQFEKQGITTLDALLR